MLSAPSRESVEDARDEPGVFMDAVVETDAEAPSYEKARESAAEEAELDTERSPVPPLPRP